MTIAAHDIHIDLNDDGTFAAGEEVTGDIVAEGGPLIFSQRGLDAQRVLTPGAAGNLRFTLDDGFLHGNGDYAPGGNLKQGRKTRWQAVFASTTYDLFLGIADNPKQRHRPFSELVGVSVLGMLSRLAGQTVDTAVFQNITTDVAIGHLLDAAGWPAADRVLDTGLTTLEWWWLDREDAMVALLALVATEGPGSWIYEDGKGRLVFRNRHAIVTDTRSTTSQSTHDGNPGAGLPLGEGFNYDQNMRDVVNVCTVRVTKRSKASLQEVWTLGEQFTLGPSESRSFEARQKDGEPFTDAVAPSEGAGDFTVVTGTVSTVVLDRTSGGSVTITITAASNGVTITALRLRAQPLQIDREIEISNSIDTSASQSASGQRTFRLKSREEIAIDAALDFCNGVVAFWQDGRPKARVPVRADASSTEMTAALAREVGDRITVIEPQSGLNKDFHIQRIGHSIKEPSQWMATLECEQATAGALILGTSELDGLDVLWW